MTYDVTDSSGNDAVQLSRIVNVVSGNSPLLTLIGTSPIFIEVGDTYVDL